MSEQSEGRRVERNNTRVLIFSALLTLIAFLIILIILTRRAQTGILINIILILLTVLAVALLVLLIRFFKAVSHIDENAKQLSQGKLNISDILESKTRGLESLTSAVNEMKRNLLSFIESTKINVIVLSDAVDNITKSLDMSYKGNEHIASSMATVAEKAQQQLKIVKDTLAGIEEVANRANNITTTLARIESL